MAEYALPAHRVPEYLSARERTARWVNHYSPEAVYSPSHPPTPIEGYNYPPSPAASVHSLPPKMVLRYNDGRGDVPISPSHSDYHGRPDRRRRAPGSSTSSPLSARPHDSSIPPPAPEKINILPSRPINPTSSTSTSSSRQSHTRSKSVSRHDGSVPQIRAPLPPISRQPAHAAHSPWHPGHSRHATVTYQAGQPHYDPLVYHHPQQVGPDGMIYSHSAPPVVGNGSYFPPQSSYPSPVRSERRGRAPPPNLTSANSTGSNDSTYYVSPTGDKIHVLEHSPERSIDTASSSTKVGSPWSQTSAKKPFLSRIFGLGSQKGAVVEKGGEGRKLRRRHSLSDGNRRQELD